MASAVTHAVLPLFLGRTFFDRGMPLRFWVFSLFCSVLPDFDVLGFFLGVHYGGFWGHRGFSHSLTFAFLASVGLAIWGFRDFGLFSRKWWGIWVFFFFLISLHGVLDGMTDGGSGVAFFSPFDEGRYFLPWTPLRVSSIGMKGFFTQRGSQVLLSEIVWVWIPSMLLMALVKAAAYNRGKGRTWNSLPAEWRNRGERS
jgi:inner membrane protein